MEDDETIDIHLKSGNGSNVTLVFKNDSVSSVDCYWVNY